jgi:hypothetical protein
LNSEKDPLLTSQADHIPALAHQRGCAHRQIVTVNGLFRPFALADGRAVATWTIKRGQIVLAPFAELDPETRAALDADAVDVTRFLGQ